MLLKLIIEKKIIIVFPSIRLFQVSSVLNFFPFSSHSKVNIYSALVYRSVVWVYRNIYDDFSSKVIKGEALSGSVS